MTRSSGLITARILDGRRGDALVPGRPWRDTGYGLGMMIGHGGSGQVFTGHTGGGPGSTAAVYQAHPACTAAAFARNDDPATVETRAQILAGDPE